ncbi:MAG: YhcH/YjgK/YiaL family protein [Dysgonomonas sp.]
MKKFPFKHIVALATLLSLSCTLLYAEQTQKKDKLTKKQSEWFNKKGWLQGISAQPDASIDIATFAHHYEKHPQRWEKVFKFISENDLASIPLGKQSLGDDVTVNVQEYTTIDPGKELLEGHKKKIDLQLVVTGRELQGYAKMKDTTETVNPYNEKKDIAHYKVPVITYHVIRANQFTIFFPDDIHFTNVQYGEKEKVRKVVFKIAVD